MRVPHLGAPPSSRSHQRATDRCATAGDPLTWLVVLSAGCLLMAGIWLLGSPVGDLLFQGHRLHPLPAYLPQVEPKPAQLGRFVIAVLIVFAGAAALAAAPRRARLPAGRLLMHMRPLVVAGTQLAVLAVAVWAWRGQNEGVNRLTAIQFKPGSLVIATLIAVALIIAAVRGWLTFPDRESTGRRRVLWIGLALIVTALWLAPALYRSLNLSHAMPAVWYPLQFTFDDFLSVLDGRTPLVNYDTQYASLLPFATEPVFNIFGSSVGTFTTLMWALSLLSFMCVERSLALIARSERLAILLYVPLLAISLFTLRHIGDERYFMANYYEVIPIRYAGPYVLFWCSVRHLRGLRPRRATLLFAFAGLVAINNTEFGVPALGGCLLAVASARLVPRSGSPRRLRGLLAQIVVGLVLATLVVAAITLLRAGSLPQFSRLTRYQQIYAITGFDLSPTPDAGLHIIIFLTFAAALVVAALRIRSQHADRVMTGALAFSGTFGIGAGSYYMGRSLPEVLAALFSAWGLATVLLCLLVLEALKDPATGHRIRPAQVLPAAAALVMFGLFVTCLVQFPAPWTQWQRLARNTHTLQFNTAPAASFVRAVSQPGEHVALLTSLGHLIAQEADVVDVSPYSHPDGIVTYEQLDDVIDALHAGHGSKLLTGAILPEVGKFLTAKGFRVVAQDTRSSLTEWRRDSQPPSHKA